MRSDCKSDRADDFFRSVGFAIRRYRNSAFAMREKDYKSFYVAIQIIGKYLLFINCSVSIT